MRTKLSTLPGDGKKEISPYLARNMFHMKSQNNKRITDHYKCVNCLFSLFTKADVLHSQTKLSAQNPELPGKIFNNSLVGVRNELKACECIFIKPLVVWLEA